MLTRLSLKASGQGPWSDNGSAKNPALPPVEKLGKGSLKKWIWLYSRTKTYLTSETNALKLQSYYQSGAKDGKADLSNLVATTRI